MIELPTRDGLARCGVDICDSVAQTCQSMMLLNHLRSTTSFAFHEAVKAFSLVNYGFLPSALDFIAVCSKPESRHSRDRGSADRNGST